MHSFWNFLKKNKLYGAVNLIGLTVSMAFVLLLAAYVQRQLRTDSFQENADRIYIFGNEETLMAGYWLDKHLKNEFPEIEKGCAVAKLAPWADFHIDGMDGELAKGSVTCADSTFFEIFSYELAEGNKADWKGSWDRCMVSEEFARTHFPGQEVIGRVLYSEAVDADLTICGVFKDFGNSIIVSPDILVRGEMMWKTNSANNEHMSNASSSICVLMAHPGADLPARRADILSWCEENYWLYRSRCDVVRLVPLRDVYFLKDNAVDGTLTLQFGNRDLVNLLLGMCLVLLAFAVLNYINMTTALTGFRAKEMATRRLVGADKKGIFFKIISESTLICGISMVLAVLLAEALAPAASSVLDYQVSIFGAISPMNVLLVFVFILVLGFLSGLIPALLIQKAQPIEIVRGTLRRKTKTTYSKLIIVVQNVVAVVMIVSALTMNLQIHHLVNADLGYNTKDIMVIGNHYGNAGDLRPLLDRWKAEPCVEAIGLGNGTPLAGTNNMTAQLSSGNWVSFQQIVGDDGYFSILGLRKKQDNHIANNWWLNEYAFKQIGIEEDAESFDETPIGGIYYDFKIKPLETDQFAALIFNYGECPEETYPWTILVKTNGDHAAAIQALGKSLAEIHPDRSFEPFYLEDQIADGFANERRVLKIVFIFTLLSILVSALGLFAMSSYYMQQETRSVSVKKVFGADRAGILRQLILAFMELVGISFVIAVPVGYFIMNRWLEGFSHHIGLHGWIFAVSGLAVAFLAAFSVLYQSIRTANTNPAESLKKE